MSFFSMNKMQLRIAVFSLLFLAPILVPQSPAQENWQNRTESKYSFEEEPSIKLGEWAGGLKVGPGMNAAGKFLKGSKFVGQNLQGAIFDRCDLDGVWFVECDLSGASFKRAHLTGAHIEASGLAGADFSNAIVNGLGLASSNLSEKQLKSTYSYRTKNLSECTISAGGASPVSPDKPLVKYDFRKANLCNAFLKNGDFSGCDLTDASISGIRMQNAKITAKQLVSTQDYRKRRLRHMSFMNILTVARGPCAICGPVNFSGFNLTGTAFRGIPLVADFSDATITECSFDLTLTKEQLCATRNYREGNLVKIRLLGIDLSGCDFSNMNLTGSKFIRSNLSGAKLDDAVITDADFGTHRDWKSKGLTFDQIRSTWNYKHGRMAGVRLPGDIAKALQAEAEEKQRDRKIGRQKEK